MIRHEDKVLLGEITKKYQEKQRCVCVLVWISERPVSACNLGAGIWRVDSLAGVSLSVTPSQGV